MSRRHYINNAPEVTLPSALNTSDTSFSVSSLIGFPPAVPFYAVLERGTASSETVLVTGVSGTTVTVTRNADGLGAISHLAGAKFAHALVAADLDEANVHVNSTTGVHGVTGHLVGDSDSQTLTNKTISGPEGDFATSTIGALTVTGSATLGDVTAGTLHGPSATPAGAVIPFAGLVIPSGWLLCDGSAVSRTTFAALFAATNVTLTPTAVAKSGTTPNITTTVTVASTAGLGVGARIQVGTNGFGGAVYNYVKTVTSTQFTFHGDATGGFTVGQPATFSAFGTGDGSTTFNVPDLRGSFLQGAAIGGGTGDNGGAATHNHGLSAGYAQIAVANNAVYSNQLGSEPTWTVTAKVSAANTTASGVSSVGAQLAGQTDDQSSLPPFTAVQYIIKT